MAVRLAMAGSSRPGAKASPSGRWASSTKKPATADAKEKATHASRTRNSESTMASSTVTPPTCSTRYISYPPAPVSAAVERRMRPRRQAIVVAVGAGTRSGTRSFSRSPGAMGSGDSRGSRRWVAISPGTGRGAVLRVPIDRPRLPTRACRLRSETRAARSAHLSPGTGSSAANHSYGGWAA